MADGRAEARAIAREHLDALRLRSERDFDLAHAEHRAGGEGRLLYARARDLGAVGRSEVFDVNAFAGAHELAVVTRDGVVGENELVVGGFADAERA